MDPLKILGLSVGCSIEDAKASFRALSIMYHPDKNGADASADNFLEISKAYKAIQENPALLDPLNSSNGYSKDGSSIYARVLVQYEDLFYSRVKTVKIKRMNHCMDCSGTGSTDKVFHQCDLCSGEGIIKGSILPMMGKGSKCPECVGSGINVPEDLICEKCDGSSLVQETKEERIKLNTGFIKNQSVIFKYSGNFGPWRGNNGGLYVKLIMETSEDIQLIDKKLHIKAPISPAMHILGGKIKVDIFGKKYTCHVKPYTKNTEITAAGNKVCVTFDLEWPKVTEETSDLYKKLLKIESNQ